MRLARIGESGRETPVVEIDGVLRDLSTLTPDIDGTFLDTVLPGLDPRDLPALDRAGTRFGPPVAGPSKVIGIGLNYRSYAAGLGVDPPASPVVFLKAPSSVCGPTDAIRPLPGSTSTDFEVELALVIGHRLRGLVDRDTALAAVAGYTLANDVTDRDLAAGGGPWARGKCADTFCPLGPWLVTPDEVSDPGSVELRLSVNGIGMQDGSTSDMVFDVPDILVHLSGLMTLEPGDVILTGTPVGTAVTRAEPRPYLRDGDLVEADGGVLGLHRSPVGAGGPR